ncbi:MAG: rhombosortase [Steroidobacteraceae bacterium]
MRRPDGEVANWLTAAVLAAVVVALWFAGPAANEALRYDREAVLAGQWWRLATGHLVHADGAHLGWNLAGAALVWWLFSTEYSWRGWCAIAIASAAAIDAGFLAFQPDLEWYVGLSGVLHGCMAAGLAGWIARSRDPLVLVIAAIFAAKLGWEQWQGPLPFTAGTLAVPVIVEAHGYGALGGLAAAAGLGFGRRSHARL